MKLVWAIDDNEDQLRLMEATLRRCCELVTLSSRSAVQEELKNEAPRLILLDMHVHVHDAETILGILRANASTASTPVILVSGAMNVREEAVRLGCAGHLSKPYTNKEIRDLVTRWLSLP